MSKNARVLLALVGCAPPLHVLLLASDVPPQHLRPGDVDGSGRPGVTAAAGGHLATALASVSTRAPDQISPTLPGVSLPALARPPIDNRLRRWSDHAPGHSDIVQSPQTLGCYRTV